VVVTTLRVPDRARPVIGDLILIDHAEPVGPDANTDGNPLVVDGLQLFPAFEPTVSLRSRNEINFAVSMLFEPGTIAPDAMLSISESGRLLSSLMLPMKPPAASGRLMAVGRVPLEGLPPGRFELRITIGTGPEAQVRTARMTVRE
jgi:hypothetical protein